MKKSLIGSLLATQGRYLFITWIMINEYNNGSTAVSAVTLVVDFSEMQESINCIEDVN